jgi:hypothetical protein
VLGEASKEAGRVCAVGDAMIQCQGEHCGPHLGRQSLGSSAAENRRLRRRDDRREGIDAQPAWIRDGERGLGRVVEQRTLPMRMVNMIGSWVSARLRRPPAVGLRSGPDKIWA